MHLVLLNKTTHVYSTYDQNWYQIQKFKYLFVYVENLWLKNDRENWLNMIWIKSDLKVEICMQ